MRCGVLAHLPLTWQTAGMPPPKGKPNPKWVKGVSGNPSGMAKRHWQFIRTCRKYSPNALGLLLRVLSDYNDRPSAALAPSAVKAAQILLDYGWGKPRETVELEVRGRVAGTLELGGLSLDELTTLARIGRSVADDPQLPAPASVVVDAPASTERVGAAVAPGGDSGDAPAGVAGPLPR